MSIPTYEICSHFSRNYFAFLRSGIFAEYLKIQLLVNLFCFEVATFSVLRFLSMFAEKRAGACALVDNDYHVTYILGNMKA